MYSAHNEGKSVFAEIFIRTLILWLSQGFEDAHRWYF